MSRDMVYEIVPPVSRREGDNVIAGQNNATIILGRDRAGPVDSGYGTRTNGGGKGAGAAHMVVGRKGADPSIADDAASVYISAKTDPDSQAETSMGVAQKSVSAAIVRADCIRIVPRTDFKVSVGKAYLTIQSDGKVVLEGDIQLGAGAAERILRGDAFRQYWSGPGHVHPTPAGLSGPPQPFPETLLSPSNKVT